MEQKSPADTDPDKLTNQQMVQIEVDMRRRADAGYSIDDLNIPMTPELQRIIYEIKLATRAKEADEENAFRHLQSVQEKHGQEQNDKFADAMEGAQRHWLASDHTFAGMVYSGAEWREIGDYTKNNRQQIMSDWLQKGMSREKIEKGLEAFEILRHGNPTEKQQKRLDEIEKDPEIRSFMQDVAENSGVRHEVKRAMREIDSSLLDNSASRNQARDDLFQSVKDTHCLTATYNDCVSLLSKEPIQQAQVFKSEPLPAIDM